MASPPLRGSPEWSAKRELEVLLGLTRGNYYAAQQLWLQRERYKAEASQVASAGSPQASQWAAGSQAKPATARAWFLFSVLRVSHCHSAVCALPRL